MSTNVDDALLDQVRHRFAYQVVSSLKVSNPRGLMQHVSPIHCDNAGVSAAGDDLHVLMDTNIVLALEGEVDSDHVNGEQAAEAHRLVQDLGGTASILENQLDDLSRIADANLRARRQRQLRKYPRLARVDLSLDFLNDANYRTPLNPESNDGVDAALLLALSRNAATWLVTEDRGLHRHARQFGIARRVMRLVDLLGVLRALKGQIPPHYSVDLVQPHVVDPEQRFFRSLEKGYPGFGSWWEDRVVAKRRKCMIIGDPSSMRGLAVLDEQDPQVPGFPSSSVKICTFKIEESSQGRKLGETLLDATIAAIRATGAQGCFVEVNIDHVALTTMLREFGFFDLELKDGRADELVLGKILDPAADSTPVIDPLAFNRKYGPGRRIVERAFVVPIVPLYHGMLFPGAEPQMSLFDTTYGNAIRKVYICHSPTKSLEPGDTLLFYRTHDNHAIHAVGVVEDTLRTRIPTDVFGFAGARTVYSAEQIRAMCTKEVLAIRFRLDQVVKPPVTRRELRIMGVFDSSPQSITRLKSKEALEWAQALEDA